MIPALSKLNIKTEFAVSGNGAVGTVNVVSEGSYIVSPVTNLQGPIYPTYLTAPSGLSPIQVGCVVSYNVADVVRVCTRSPFKKAETVLPSLQTAM